MVWRGPAEWVVNELELEDASVRSRFDFELREPLEHVGAHVGDHQPLGSDLAPVLHQRPVVEVIGDALLVEVGLADEEVAVLGRLRERLGPLRVAGVRYDAAPDRKAKGVGGSPALVSNHVGRYRQGFERGRYVRLDLDDPGLEFSLDAGRAGEEDLHRLPQSLGETW